MAKKKKAKPKPQKKKKKGNARPKPQASPGPSPRRTKAAPVDDGPVQPIQGLAQFNKYVYQSDKPAIVDFWAEWCGPCKAMTPLFKEFAEEHSDEIFFAKVDTERSPDIAEELNIRSLPTFLAFHEGKVIDMKVGVVMPVAMEKWIEKLKKKTGITKDAPPPTPTPTAQPEEAKKPKTLGQKLRGWFGGGK